MIFSLDEHAVPAEGGGNGFTVNQTMRLLGCSESKVRNRFNRFQMRDDRNRLLCPAEEVLAERRRLLQRLGAVEAGASVDEDLGNILKERDELRMRLASAEEKIRLMAAARSAAREKVLNSLTEEQAYMEMALLDLDPLRTIS